MAINFLFEKKINMKNFSDVKKFFKIKIIFLIKNFAKKKRIVRKNKQKNYLFFF